jgi:hypothetical protein
LTSIAAWPFEKQINQEVIMSQAVANKGRAHLWRVAYGSAKEVDSHLRLLISARAVNTAQAEETVQLFDCVRAMTWRLLHPTRSR